MRASYLAVVDPAARVPGEHAGIVLAQTLYPDVGDTLVGGGQERQVFAVGRHLQGGAAGTAEEHLAWDQRRQVGPEGLAGIASAASTGTNQVAAFMSRTSGS